MTPQPERDREREWDFEEATRLRSLLNRRTPPVLDPLEGIEDATARKQGRRISR